MGDFLLNLVKEWFLNMSQKTKQFVKEISQRVEKIKKREKPGKELDTEAANSDWKKLNQDFANIFHQQK